MGKGHKKAKASPTEAEAAATAAADGPAAAAAFPKQRKAEGPRFSALTPPLRAQSLAVLHAQGFERATPVQAAAIGLLAGNKDVAVGRAGDTAC
jgi:superfamily II DNA/RNA helicase